MCNFIEPIEHVLTPASCRAKMPAAAQAPESMFTAVQAAASGLDRPTYVNQTSEHPTVIVDSRMGRHFAPDDHAHALASGEMSGIPQMDQWQMTNEAALRSHVQGVFDRTID